VPFRKVLVANRGEIAVRVIRALREARIASLAVYSDADSKALHVRMADEAAHIGPSASNESYLNIERIVDTARRHGADAIHPGYGFLSENAEFASCCAAAGLVFIGPSAASIRRMGSKLEARQIARTAGAPIVPGTLEGVNDPADVRRIARAIGYPVMIKAAAGGGGKGMRRVDAEADLDSALREASSEAERAFGSGQVYVEKLLVRPRHVEIQVLGDPSGNLIHLGERECSLQRRHQKVVEECPSPLVARTPGLRSAMGDAALRIALAAGYYNAGTLEFLVDETGAFYFLEMNTRLQVEHAVTEMATGIDIVAWQLRIAAGEPLTIKQEDVGWRGSAIQCRLYAEDPDNAFFPSPGKIAGFRLPSGAGVRVDSGAYDGWTVPIDYDPLIAKIITWAGSREDAIDRMRCAVAETFIGGIKTNVGFFRRLLADDQFRAAEIHTGFIDEFLARSLAPAAESEHEIIAALISAVRNREQRATATANVSPTRSRWLTEGRGELLR
jgi:acetyl-CoA carboxylase, biotin carboxylase subunit